MGSTLNHIAWKLIDVTCELHYGFGSLLKWLLRCEIIHLVSTPDFPKNEYFLLSDTHRYVCVSGGKKYQFFEKFWKHTKWMIPEKVSSFFEVFSCRGVFRTLSNIRVLNTSLVYSPKSFHSYQKNPRSYREKITRHWMENQKLSRPRSHLK